MRDIDNIPEIERDRPREDGGTGIRKMIRIGNKLGSIKEQKKNALTDDPEYATPNVEPPAKNAWMRLLRLRYPY